MSGLESIFLFLVDLVGPRGAAVHCSQIYNGGRRVISGVKEASLFCVSRVVFRATGRPSSCPDPRTNDENTVPTTANRRSTRAEATRRAASRTGDRHCIQLAMEALEDEEFVCYLVAYRPSNMQVYLRDGSAQTILRAATLR